MDTVASAIVLAVLLGLVFMEGGANLDAPADPGSSNYPARPEWYFLSLFQMLKLFEGDLVLIGTFVIPTAIVVLLMLFPLLDKVLPGRVAHFSACTLVFALVGGATYLTYTALHEDAYNWEFQAQRLEADRARQRALTLAADPEHRIPPEGPSYLLSRDPAFHGRIVLETKCLSCHSYNGKGYVTQVITQVKPGDLEKIKTPVVIEGSPRHVATSLLAVADGFTPTGPATRDRVYGEAVYRFQGRNAQGERIEAIVSTDGKRVDLSTQSKQTASDLKGFGTKPWIRGLLEDPASPTYFGQVPQAKGMKGWKKKSKLKPKELDAVAEFITEHVSKLGPEGAVEDLVADEQASAHPGLALFKNECRKCHELGLGGEAPNLSGWGSTRWLTHMIQEPGAEDLYGYLDEDKQMPAFADRLSENDMTTLVRYLEGETGETVPTPTPTPPDAPKPGDLAAAR
jgi:mono/diheme cytochrome c family protein